MDGVISVHSMLISFVWLPSLARCLSLDLDLTQRHHPHSPLALSHELLTAADTFAAGLRRCRIHSQASRPSLQIAGSARPMRDAWTPQEAPVQLALVSKRPSCF